MFVNYLKIAWRNLLRNKLFAMINIVGLAVGLAVCIVIFLIVSYELSFDKFHADGDRIYRIHSVFTGGISGKNRGVATAAADFVRYNLTGQDLVVSFHDFRTKNVRVQKNGSNSPLIDFDSDRKIICTDSAYFELIKYKWLFGSPKDVFSQPYRIALTRSKANKYFGVETDLSEVIGKSIFYRDSIELIVYGIVEDLEGHTDFKFSEFISFATTKAVSNYPGYYNDWTSTNSGDQLFVRLGKNISQDHFQTQLQLLSDEYKKQNKNGDWELNYALQPLSDLHFGTEQGIFDSSGPAVSKDRLRTLTILAVMILLIGTINFVNLETVQASKRVREIGLRKVMGGSRSSLILQFTIQSTLLTIFAVGLAFPLVQLGMVYFGEFIPKGVNFDLLQPTTWLFILGIVGVVGVGAGFYPAFVVSGFAPIKALRSLILSEKGTNHSRILRKGLIVFQFAFTQVLIACTLVVMMQNEFLATKDLGFSYANIVNLYIPHQESDDKRQTFLNELSKIPQIVEVSLHESPPATNGYSSNYMVFKTDSSETKLNVFRKRGRLDFLSFYDIPLVAGRLFTPSDSVREVVINNTLATQMGLTPSEAIGRQVNWDNNAVIVGVVNDVHFRSLHHTVEPMGFFFSTSGDCVGLKFNSGSTANMQEALSQVEKVWIQLFPKAEFSYSFLEDTLENFYQEERRTAKLISTATAITVVISCLGLFGLVSFTALQRTKEIGIRKVLGASVSNIVKLLSKDFLQLILLAFLLASPIAYWLGNKWLEGFAYRISIGPLLFISTAALALLIAFLTVAQQAFKAANENPVNALRNE